MHVPAIVLTHTPKESYPREHMYYCISTVVTRNMMHICWTSEFGAFPSQKGTEETLISLLAVRFFHPKTLHVSCSYN